MGQLVWIPAVGYLLGSLPVGVWAARLRGATDPRSAGSGGSGATNVLRVDGAAPAAAVLVLDVAKGAAAVLLARRLAGGVDDWTVAATAAAAVLGHLYPVFASFRGGKGVATSAGAALLLDPWAAAAGALSFMAVLAVDRRVSAGSLTAVAVFAGAILLRHGASPLLAFALAATFLVVFAHRSNIGRIAAGSEPRLFRGGR